MIPEAKRFLPTYPIFFRIKGQKILQSTYLEHMVCHFHKKVQTPERVQTDLDLVGKTLVGLYPVRKYVFCFCLEYHSYGGDLHISIAFVFQLTQRGKHGNACNHLLLPYKLYSV